MSNEIHFKIHTWNRIYIYIYIYDINERLDVYVSIKEERPIQNIYINKLLIELVKGGMDQKGK